MVAKDRDGYVLEANRQNCNSQVYEEVDRDPTIDVINNIESIMQDLRMNDLSWEEEGEYLISGGSRLDRFYLFSTDS